jgi:hypothetical protein
MTEYEERMARLKAMREELKASPDRDERERKRKEEAARWKANNPDPPGLIALKDMIYIMALESCIRKLPQKPPKNWDEAALIKARRKAKIIMKRLAVFNEGDDRQEKADNKNIIVLLKVGPAISADELTYIGALDQCMKILRKAEVPKQWREEELNLARGYANIINKRLKVFNVQEIKESM